MPLRVFIDFLVTGTEAAIEAFRKLGDAFKELADRMKANTIAIPTNDTLVAELAEWRPDGGIRTREEAEKRARDILRRDY
ncbi:MAG TPA: hypothetical protein VF761_17090 [Gemmatimonadaceae bacterium]